MSEHLVEALRFESESPEAEHSELELTAFRGRETISQLFEYELDLFTSHEGGLSPDAIDDLLRQPCSIRFGPGGTSVVHGRLRGIELYAAREARILRYRAWLVPRLWEATLYRRSRVFQEKNVLEIVVEILNGDYGLEADNDFVVLADRSKYPTRDYTVQYQETDLAFISRLLEYEGIFFYFQHLPSSYAPRAAREYFVIGDQNAHFTSFALGPDALPYDPRSVDTVERGSITDLGRRTEVRPGKVHLVDYDWRRPSPVEASAPCDTKTGGATFYHHYGDHFRAEDGDRLARVRAEELMTSRVVYPGRARSDELSIGHRFEIVGHPVPEFDQQYVVTEVSHEIVHDGEEGSASRREKGFSAIAYDTPFRPARITPLPKIDGFTHGIVDSDGDPVAPLDELGQYTVVVPYDLHGRPGGRASTRRIRMAQPASGNTNVHFPLDANAEVAIVHLGGDPDRPLIVGSPPHKNARVSVDVGGNKDNRTQSLIETRGGVFIEFEDDW